MLDIRKVSVRDSTSTYEIRCGFDYLILFLMNCYKTCLITILNFLAMHLSF